MGDTINSVNFFGNDLRVGCSDDLHGVYVCERPWAISQVSDVTVQDGPRSHELTIDENGFSHLCTKNILHESTRKLDTTLTSAPSRKYKIKHR